ncbi:MAG: PHP domain-containing protein [Neisseriaceae bacterium]|nr:MAG: PHP domain-containing protein [Neisseriaceae bacterium]
MDGYGLVEEYANRAVKINQKFLTVSDHGMMGAIPRQIRACEKASSKVKDTLSPIFACELYVNSMQPECASVEDLQSFTKNLDDVQKKRFRSSSHLLAIAYNEVGYKNLVRLTSWGWTKGFYYKPRVNHDMLLKHKEGLYFTSCCYNSEVGRAFDQGGEEAGFAMIEKQIEMFGKDHYFLEFMLLDFAKQKPYNKFIIDAHEKYKLPLIVTNDCHVCNKEDSKYQSLMMMVQTGKTIADIQRIVDEEGSQDIFELQDTNLWMKSEEEISEKWAKDYSDVIPYELFCDAKRNTVKICESAKGIQLDRGLKLPVLQDCDEILAEEVKKGFLKKNLPKSKVYIDRLREELSLITRKGFSSYFLIQKMMTDEARRSCSKLLGWGDGSQAVGPGRGCLAPEVPIITKNGVLKPIKDVLVGDSVLTRDGTFQRVINTAVYPLKDETLISLYAYYGDNRGVSLTKDHKVLVEKGKRVKAYGSWSKTTQSSRKSIVEPNGDLIWKRADEIELGDWLYIPIPKVEIKSPEIFDLSKFSEDKDLVSEKEVYQDWTNPLTKQLRKRKICNRYLNFNSELFWKVVGLFAGDGWKRSDDSNRIGFALHSENNLENLCILKSFAESMKIDWSMKKSSTKKLIQFYMNNKYIKNLFDVLFNMYKCTPETKHIPEMVFSLPDNLKWAFLKGYFLSDGHQAENKISFDSKSETLAAQVKFLLLLLGQPSSINYGKRLDKRTNKRSFCFKINTPSNLMLGIKKSTKNYVFRKAKDGILLKVRKIGEQLDVKFVHDFEVENNHNYATSSFIVHNSAVGALTCYCLGITSVDPVQEGLLFSRFMSEARGGRSIVLDFKNIDPLPPEEVFVE